MWGGQITGSGAPIEIFLLANARVPPNRKAAHVAVKVKICRDTLPKEGAAKYFWGTPFTPPPVSCPLYNIYYYLRLKHLKSLEIK